MDDRVLTEELGQIPFEDISQHTDGQVIPIMSKSGNCFIPVPSFSEFLQDLIFRTLTGAIIVVFVLSTLWLCDNFEVQESLLGAVCEGIKAMVCVASLGPRILE
jgi:hypothetical protein